ncbi:MAG: hypothetical protein K9G26_03350 [Emcibacter sp.]|nr:hypothetical protein [Emcibacter sp.]
MRILTIIFLLLIVVSTSYAQSVTTLWQQAGQAYDAQNFALFQFKIEELEKQRPYQLAVKKNLIRAYSLNGKIEKATKTIEQIIAQGLSMEFTDPDFKMITDHAAYEKWAKQLSENNQPLGQESIFMTIDEKGLLPESVTYHEKTGDYFIGSVREGKILRISQHKAVSSFVTASEKNQLTGIFGLKIDQKNNHLWVASNNIEQHISLNKNKENISGIFQFDITTGKLLHKYFPNDGKKNLFGDLIISPQGEIYVSDSYNPIIYKINKNTKSLEPFVAGDHFVNLQGLCIANNRLYVADYNKGLYSIDLKSKAIIALQHKDNINVGGIDGLYCQNHKLIAIQNGITPNRIIRLEVKDNKIDKLHVLNRNLPQWNEPTLGMIHKNSLYYVATSQWGAYDKDGSVKKDATLLPILIMKTKIE